MRNLCIGSGRVSGTGSCQNGRSRRRRSAERNRLDAARFVIGEPVDQRAHGMRMHVIRGIRTERDLVARVPGAPGVGRQDDRQAAVNRRDRRVGTGGEDGEGLERPAGLRAEERPRRCRTLRRRPALPEAGEGEGQAVAEGEQLGPAGPAPPDRRKPARTLIRGAGSAAIRRSRRPGPGSVGAGRRRGRRASPRPSVTAC